MSQSPHPHTLQGRDIRLPERRLKKGFSAHALALAQPEESSPCTRRAASQSWAMDSAEKLATIGSARTARTLDWQCAMLKSAKDNCSGALPLVSEYSPLIACSSSLRYVGGVAGMHKQAGGSRKDRSSHWRLEDRG